MPSCLVTATLQVRTWGKEEEFSRMLHCRCGLEGFSQWWLLILFSFTSSVVTFQRWSGRYCSLAVLSINVYLNTGSSNWVERLTSGQLRDSQLADSNNGLVILWLENDIESSKWQLLWLTSPETKALWSCCNQLFFQMVFFFIIGWILSPV